MFEFLVLTDVGDEECADREAHALSSEIGRKDFRTVYIRSGVEGSTVESNETE